LGRVWAAPEIGFIEMDETISPPATLYNLGGRGRWLERKAMGTRSLASVHDGVTTLFDGGTTASLGDHDLLERYVARRDEVGEAAFAALVARNGPLVLRVCQGILRDCHDADDAFQATFLILARKAGSIRHGKSIASWLFGVARRVAIRAREDRSRRIRRERLTIVRVVRPDLSSSPSDWMPEIHEEIDRLPEKYRAPVLLCDLEGLTHEEAATALRAPVGTVKVRLSRARHRLRGRLLKRGLAPATLLVSFVDRGSATIPDSLARSTLSAAMLLRTGRSGVSEAVVSLMRGVLRTMLVTQLKAWATPAALALILVLAATLGASLVPRPARSDPIGRTQEKAKAKPDSAQAPAPSKTANPITQTVKRSDISTRAHLAATARAFETALLYPAVSGIINKVQVELGDRVKPGQVLAEIAAPELESDLQMSRAVVQKAKAQVVLSQARVKLAKVELQMAQGERNRDSDRQWGLARVKVEAAEAEGLVANAELAIAEAGLLKAETRLGVTRVTSPFDGIVIRRACNVGQMIIVGTAQASTPLLTVARTDKMRVVVNVPENNVPSLDVGDAATVWFPMLGMFYEGKVSRMDGALDDQTATLRAEIDVPNKDGRLRDGLFGKASIVLDTHKGAITIPSSAIVGPQAGDQAKCFRLVDGHAVLTPITTGWEDEGQIEVLGGLEPDDVVVVRSVDEVKDGQTIGPAN
jgi:RND family efflux transporter MFP subunit